MNYIKKPLPIHPMMYDIPKKATIDGELTLKWNQKPRQEGNSRGCQVAEVWLMKRQFVESEKGKQRFD
jgi:hypothetical protein